VEPLTPPRESCETCGIDLSHNGGHLCSLLRGYSYSPEKIRAARDADRLLCLRMETNENCNLSCLYCYSNSHENRHPHQMSFRGACDAVDQARELGIESMVYLGGEPLLYDHFWPFVEHVCRHDIAMVIFTNGMLIDATVAQHLSHLGTSIMLKWDGMEHSQDLLTGSGTYARIRAALTSLLKAGFAVREGQYTRLGLSACATKINSVDVLDVWRFARMNNIFPNVEIATRIGRASGALTLTNGESCRLIETLRKIDAEEFGIKWFTAHSAIPAHSCGIFLAGAAVKADRGVALCPEMPAVASLADTRLSQIIQESPFSAARYLESRIEKPCSSCEFFSLCLGGCRSKALVRYGSIFSPDPNCIFLNRSTKDSQGKDENGTDMHLETLPSLEEAPHERSVPLRRGNSRSSVGIAFGFAPRGK